MKQENNTPSNNCLARKRGRRRQQLIPESSNGLDRVFIWDIDGSLVRGDVVRAIGQPETPSVLASVTDKMGVLAERLKDLTLNFCEQHFHLSEMNSSDQVHIEDSNINCNRAAATQPQAQAQPQPRAQAPDGSACAQSAVGYVSSSLTSSPYHQVEQADAQTRSLLTLDGPPLQPARHHSSHHADYAPTTTISHLDHGASGELGCASQAPNGLAHQLQAEEQHLQYQHPHETHATNTHHYHQHLQHQQHHQQQQHNELVEYQMQLDNGQHAPPCHHHASSDAHDQLAAYRGHAYHASSMWGVEVVESPWHQHANTQAHQGVGGCGLHEAKAQAHDGSGSMASQQSVVGYVSSSLGAAHTLGLSPYQQLDQVDGHTPNLLTLEGPPPSAIQDGAGEMLLPGARHHSAHHADYAPTSTIPHLSHSASSLGPSGELESAAHAANGLGQHMQQHDHNLQYQHQHETNATNCHLHQQHELHHHHQQQHQQHQQHEHQHHQQHQHQANHQHQQQNELLEYQMQHESGLQSHAPTCQHQLAAYHAPSYHASSWGVEMVESPWHQQPNLHNHQGVAGCGLHEAKAQAHDGSGSMASSVGYVSSSSLGAAHSLTSSPYHQVEQADGQTRSLLTLEGPPPSVIADGGRELLLQPARHHPAHHADYAPSSTIAHLNHTDSPAAQQPQLAQHQEPGDSIEYHAYLQEQPSAGYSYLQPQQQLSSSESAPVHDSSQLINSSSSSSEQTLVGSTVGPSSELDYTRAPNALAHLEQQQVRPSANSNHKQSAGQSNNNNDNNQNPTPNDGDSHHQTHGHNDDNNNLNPNIINNNNTINNNNNNNNQQQQQQQKQFSHRLSAKFNKIRAVYNLNRFEIRGSSPSLLAKLEASPIHNALATSTANNKQTTISNSTSNGSSNNATPAANGFICPLTLDAQSQAATCVEADESAKQSEQVARLRLELDEILADIDHYTLDWRKRSLECLRLIGESQNCTNVIVTKLPLIVALGYLICLGFGALFPVDQIYSANKSSKETCIKRIKKRYGQANRCSYIIVGGREDVDMAKRLDLPSWNTSHGEGHRQLVQLISALEAGWFFG